MVNWFRRDEFFMTAGTRNFGTLRGNVEWIYLEKIYQIWLPKFLIKFDIPNVFIQENNFFLKNSNEKEIVSFGLKQYKLRRFLRWVHFWNRFNGFQTVINNSLKNEDLKQVVSSAPSPHYQIEKKLRNKK